MRTVTRVTDLAQAAAEPNASVAQLQKLVLEELARGRQELQLKRSGYEQPLAIPFAAGVAAVPVDVALRADPGRANEREWQLTAAVVAALVDISDLPAPARPQDLALRTAELGGFLALQLPGGDAELAPLAFEERVAGIDRLRARAVVVPAGALPATDPRPPINTALHGAEATARLNDDDLVEALLGANADAARPHEDPDPARRTARRILQRLDGMGKWGGYHTEFAHLPRGFAGNERALAMAVGEALLAAGLLDEKPSVGQRHVFLNPRRAGDIHRMIESGDVPPGLTLPAAD